MSAGNTIIVNITGQLRYKEGVAAAGSAIKPGYLIAETTIETEPMPPTVNVHPTQGVAHVLQIAIEDSLQGKGIDTTYVAGEIVRSFVPKQGDRFQCWLQDGETAVFGSLLVSKGNGKFEIAATTEVASAVARSAAAPSGADAMILAEAL